MSPSQPTADPRTHRCRSGAIDLAEFSALCRSLDDQMTESEVKAAYKAIDSDSDGELSFEEFHGWWAAQAGKGGQGSGSKASTRSRGGPSRQRPRRRTAGGGRWGTARRRRRWARRAGGGRRRRRGGRRKSLNDQTIGAAPHFAQFGLHKHSQHKSAGLDPGRLLPPWPE